MNNFDLQPTAETIQEIPFILYTLEGTQHTHDYAAQQIVSRTGAIDALVTVEQSGEHTLELDFLKVSLSYTWPGHCCRVSQLKPSI